MPLHTSLVLISEERLLIKLRCCAQHCQPESNQNVGTACVHGWFPGDWAGSKRNPVARAFLSQPQPDLSPYFPCAAKFPSRHLIDRLIGRHLKLSSESLAHPENPCRPSPKSFLDRKSTLRTIFPASRQQQQQHYHHVDESGDIARCAQPRAGPWCRALCRQYLFGGSQADRRGRGQRRRGAICSQCQPAEAVQERRGALVACPCTLALPCRPLIHRFCPPRGEANVGCVCRLSAARWRAISPRRST